MQEKEKALLGADTIQEFLKQFGEPDQNVALLLNILFEELMNAQSIPLLSESKQTGDQTDLNPENGDNQSPLQTPQPK